MSRRQSETSCKSWCSRLLHALRECCLALRSVCALLDAFCAGEHSQFNARMLLTGLSKTHGLGWSRRRCCWLFAASLSWTGVVRKSVIACFAWPGSFSPDLSVDCALCSPNRLIRLLLNVLHTGTAYSPRSSKTILSAMSAARTTSNTHRSVMSDARSGHCPCFPHACRLDCDMM